MIEQSVLYIQTIISTYGVWGVFVATLVEEVIAPIPSAVVPLAAGFFLLPADGSFALIFFRSILVIAIPVAAGICIGSAMVYTLAYYGGKPLIQKNHRLLGITWEEIQRVEKRVIRGKRDELTLLALRIVPIPGVAVSGFCGAIRYPFSRFIFITFLGAGIRALALGIAGWQAGEFYFKYIDVFNHFEDQILLGVIAIFAAFFAYYLYWRNVKRKRASDLDRNVS